MESDKTIVGELELEHPHPRSLLEAVKCRCVGVRLSRASEDKFSCLLPVLRCVLDAQALKAAVTHLLGAQTLQTLCGARGTQARLGTAAHRGLDESQQHAVRSRVSEDRIISQRNILRG